MTSDLVPSSRVRQLPFGHALQYTFGALDGVHTRMVFLDQVDGSTHLLGKEKHVYPCLQSECGIRMPKLISGARHVLSALAQILFVQRICNQEIVESPGLLSSDYSQTEHSCNHHPL